MAPDKVPSRHSLLGYLKRPAFWSAVSFALGLGVWPILGYFQSRSGVNVDKIAIVCDLLQKKNETYAKIVELSEEYSKIAGADGAYYDPQSKLHIDQLNEQLRLLERSFRAAEYYLAELEDREPEYVRLEFRDLGPPGKPGTLQWKS